MSETKPRTVEMAKREILERMCSVSNPPTAYDLKHLSRAYSELDRCSTSASCDLADLRDRLSTLVRELYQIGLPIEEGLAVRIEAVLEGK